MKKQLDLNSWYRKDHFHFFRQFGEPFFGVCVQVDVTRAYAYAKEKNCSFFLYYLYASLQAANECLPFKYRIQDDQVWEFDQVHASPTINRPDGSFGFAYMDFDPSFVTFYEKARNEQQRVQASTGLVPSESGQNVIHYSAMPWLAFTSVSHARHFAFPDSCPKISFGKVDKTSSRRVMPVSIHVHHALMDGSDVATYVERFQAWLDAGL